MQNNNHSHEAPKRNFSTPIQIRDGNRLILDRSPDAKSRQDILEATALLIRAKQFMGEVESVEAFDRLNTVRIVDARLAQPTSHDQAQHLSENLFSLMRYVPSLSKDTTRTEVEDVVVDFLPQQEGPLVGAVGLVLGDTDELYIERSAVEDALDLTGLRLSERANLDIEVSMRLGYIQFASPPSTDELGSYLQMIESASPDEIGLEPYIGPNH